MFHHLAAAAVQPAMPAYRVALSLSVTAHALVIVGAIRIPVHDLRPADLWSPEAISYIAISQEALRAATGAAEGAGAGPASAASAAPRAEGGRARMPDPAAIPEEIPAPEAGLAVTGGAEEDAFGGAGAGGRGAGMKLDSVVPPPPPIYRFAYDGSEPVRPPRLRNRDEVQEVLGQLYPRRLQVRGISGEVVLRFVIDERGRVDPASVAVVSVVQEEFVRATLKAIYRFRFWPARYKGQRVPILIEMPIRWVPEG